MEQLPEQKSRSVEPACPGTERQVYATPHLLEYGSVAKLTQGNRSMTGDIFSMMRFVFPRDNPGDAPAKMR
jgi:hypothetical protein